MEQAQLWAAVAASLGTGGAATVLISGLVKYFSGSAGREKARNTDMKSQRDRAQVLLNYERERFRVISEEAAKWRRIAIAHGVDKRKLGPWPDFDQFPEEEDN